MKTTFPVLQTKKQDISSDGQQQKEMKVLINWKKKDSFHFI